MAAPRRNQAPGKPITPMVMLGAVAVAGYAIYQGYPGIAAIWAGLLVSAWMYPPAMFTGKKDARGYPSPAHPGEQAAMNRYRLWEDLKFKLALPNPDWLPGLKPRLSFLVAVWAGAAAFLVPVVNETYTQGYGPWINAAAAFISVAQFSASRRRTQVADDENPGARVDSLIALARKNLAKVIGLFIGGIAVGGVVGTVATVMLPLATTAASVPAIPEPAIWALCLTGGPLALLSRAWITEALEHWRIVVAAREEWKSRWEMLKQDPAPRLIDRQEVGAATIDTFDAPPGTGAMPFWVMADKISPTLGTGAKFAVLDVPNLDSNNQPVPGTKHPLRFEIVRWPSDQMPDITDPATPKDVVFHLVRCAIAWAADGVYSRPVIDDVHLLTVPSAPGGAGDGTEDGDEDSAAPAPAGSSVWAITWYLPDGPPASYIRANGRNEMQEALQAHVLIDHRAQNGLGCAYAGALLDADTQWDPNCGLSTKDMKKLADEDQWNNRWAEAAPKHKANPPVMEASTANTARLKNGVTVNSLAFITRQGMTPHDFFLFEHALPSTLNAAPFLTMTGYQGSGRRQGERHPQAFTVYWASEAVPAKPDDLAPVRGSDAPKWVLAGLINQAFKAAKLADRPEIASATCLTKDTSRGHIWKIDLRLYGGVTLNDVRGMAQRIKQHWAAEWLRVAAAQDGCTIVVGARPTKPGLQLASPRHEQYLESLNWDQVFLDSGISGIGGLMPVLTNVDHMPRNQQVSILDFDLPTGLDFTSFTGVRTKLEANSGNSFVEPRRVKNRANAIQLLACEVNPMPERAGYDWDYILECEFIPFATGVDGEPVSYNFKVDPHLLIAGASGGGKSVLLQSLAFGALIRGYELYVADPTKGGADFKFAEPYSKAFTATPFEAAAMMKGIYTEVLRRKNLNTEHGVGNYRDLPADIRPKHIVILLDEFTSLMGQDPVPPASDDPEMDIERDMIIATNRAKTEIGVYAGKIAREARSAGVTLFLATQKLSAKMLDTIPGAGDLKVNLSRLLMGKATYGDKQSALRAPQDAPDLGDAIPPGRGLFETTAGAAMAIQAWYDPAEQAVLREKLSAEIDPLGEEDKLDLAPFMMKLPDAPNDMPAAAAAAPRPAPSVVDLGEIELDLDDLDWSDMDLGTDEDSIPAAAEEAPAEPSVPADADELVWEQDETAVDTEAALLIDVDGVIAPFTYREGLDHLAAPGHGTVMFDTAIMSRLAAVPVTHAWLTSWEDDAPDNFGHLFPRATDVLIANTEEAGWWKIDAALDWLKENPEVRRLVWIDDELATEDVILGLTYREIAEDAFEAAGVDALLVVPNPDKGLTAADLDGIEAFFGLTGAAGPLEDLEIVVPEPAGEPAEPDWSAMEEDMVARSSTAAEGGGIPSTPSEPADDDPFADVTPKRRFVPDDDDPFA
ncbi:cell divisionFtsK/SpoIIIE (plasmid) [Pseudarthrobacter chlorophenolicus A6]|uniref:Cell divisionFtsK/SpoIIIE n=1 Tax=Pseudarthrobacter chlorophenolicus (strain ATCC 700700 / DSM 12829 / CIP 107037 / JCM 12360 / KCTC 9906 / NCIMB 13794 / A6) TaxID=452863 RepID=B8HID5_PSECP|nr:FtsK/SpoIIIE domain-containing protein [Pseudarthrobacter chlorophenolicus]ACL42182.1 cell divisionFtsK/SpoIIIE [Pseudarthrobacter chlorophenolicus A6]SDQ14524.1 FtsK/SpoIIIE family protein [Pseudarthrobacter chlorophenolicus]